MKICLIEDSYRWGGSQKWLKELVVALKRDNFGISLISPTFSWIYREIESYCDNIFSYDYYEISELLNKDYYLEKWYDCIVECDLVFATVYDQRNNFQNISFCVECIKKYDLNIPFIIRTGTICKTRMKSNYIPDDDIVSIIIASSTSTRFFLINHLNINPNKIIVMHQGVDISCFNTNQLSKQLIKNKYKISSCKTVIGIIGYFEEKKGHLFFLDVFNILLNTSNTDLYLIFVGDGPYKINILEKINTLDIDTNVLILPFMDNLQEIYQLFDFFVLPSINKEGLPNVILEAISMYVPIITSNIPGVNDVIIDNKTGFIFEKLNINNCVEKINYVLNLEKKEIEKVKNNAFSLVLKSHNREILLKKYTDYFINEINLNNSKK